MTSRRKLPAPPLVLTPYFAREYEGTQAADRLRGLAIFLAEKNLLTQGGIKSLEEDLCGRNGAVSLSLQDVRSWAHGLVQKILVEEPTSGRGWHQCLVDYTARFDKGKPRRPTHLQRLYLEWSDDLSWPGLLRSAATHPRIWDELEIALGRMEDDCEDKRVLSLASQCRETSSAWMDRLDSEPKALPELLKLLPLLESGSLQWRVEMAARIAAGRRPEPWLVSALVQACRCTFLEASELKRLPFEVSGLERATLLYCAGNKEFMAPLFLCGLRGFVTSKKTVEAVLATISADDPLRRVTYGSRPGHSWIKVYESELLGFCDARSST